MNIYENIKGSDKKLSNRQERLGKLLNMIQQIDQSIIDVKEIDKLLLEICAHITNHEFTDVWIALFDTDKQIYKIEAIGDKKEIELLKSDLLSKKVPSCVETRNKKTSPGINVPTKKCNECILKKLHLEDSATILKIEHQNRLYGIMGLYTNERFIDNIEFFTQINNMTENIAQALMRLHISNKE